MDVDRSIVVDVGAANGVIGAPPESGSGSRPTGPEALKTRACANCARLKMKCRWPESGEGKGDTGCIRCDCGDCVLVGLGEVS